MDSLLLNGPNVVGQLSNDDTNDRVEAAEIGYYIVLISPTNTKIVSDNLKFVADKLKD